MGCSTSDNSTIFTKLDDPVVHCDNFPSAYSDDADESSKLELKPRTHTIVVSRVVGIRFTQVSDPVQWVYGAVDGIIGTYCLFSFF